MWYGLQDWPVFCDYCNMFQTLCILNLHFFLSVMQDVSMQENQPVHESSVKQRGWFGDGNCRAEGSFKSPNYVNATLSFVKKPR
jgi:hypothetical protein